VVFINKDKAKEIFNTIKKSGYGQDFQARLLYKEKLTTGNTQGHYSLCISSNKFKVEWLDFFIKYFGKNASTNLASQLTIIKNSL